MHPRGHRGMLPQEMFEMYMHALRLLLVVSGAPKNAEIIYEKLKKKSSSKFWDSS